MRSFFRKYLGSSLAARHRPGFNADLFSSSYWPTLLVGILIALFEVAMIVTTLVRPSLMQSHSRQVHLALYIVLLAVTAVGIAGCLVWQHWLRAHPAVFITLTVAYGAAICLWGDFLTAYSHRTSGNISVFLYVTLGVAIVVSLRPWQALALFGGSQLAFILLLLHYAGPQVQLFPSIINSVIATLLGILIASLLYLNRTRDYLNRITIVQQNREIRNINEQLRQLVFIDDLTKANNRRYFDELLPERLNRARKAGRTFCIMMFDLDHFKQFNDLYGHQAGDDSLVAFAGIIHRFLQGKNGAFVRYGGEEFLLCLEGYDERSGLKAAEEIRAGLAEENIPHNGGDKGHLTVSTGVRITHPGDDTTLQQLVSEADNALYIAKNAGRDRVKLFS